MIHWREVCQSPKNFPERDRNPVSILKDLKQKLDWRFMCRNLNWSNFNAGNKFAANVDALRILVKPELGFSFQGILYGNLLFWTRMNMRAQTLKYGRSLKENVRLDQQKWFLSHFYKWKRFWANPTTDDPVQRTEGFNLQVSFCSQPHLRRL